MVPNARRRAAIAILVVIALWFAISRLGTGHSGLHRATGDRPDDFSGPQIHFVYAVPSGSPDNDRDVDGTLSESIVLLFSWFHQQAGAPRLAINTFKGRPDITFVALPRSNAAYQKLGPDAIAADVSRLLPPRPRKLYGIYYQGTLPRQKADVCGLGRAGPDRFAIAYIGQACFDNDDFLNADVGGYNTLVFVMAHELVHELGFVPPCAPHSTKTGHVDDSTADLMYPILGSGVPILDVNNDDYYRAHIPGCPDLSTSPSLHGPRSLLGIKR